MKIKKKNRRNVERTRSIVDDISFRGFSGVVHARNVNICFGKVSFSKGEKKN